MVTVQTMLYRIYESVDGILHSNRSENSHNFKQTMLKLKMNQNDLIQILLDMVSGLQIFDNSEKIPLFQNSIHCYNKLGHRFLIQHYILAQKNSTRLYPNHNNDKS